MLICVTNRHLCEEDFLLQIKRIAAAKPTAILLREKDLSPTAYQILVGEVAPIVDQYGVPLWSYLPPLPPSNVEGRWHLPYPQFTALLSGDYNKSTPKIPTATFGVSVHTTTEAEIATRHGADYLLAGHIFPTNSKPGSPGRGLSFLQNIVTATAVAAQCDSLRERVAPPVYAIGGITPENSREIRRTGAAGICVMSALMKSAHPDALIARYQFHWESSF